MAIERRHCTHEEVDAIRNRLRRDEITDGAIAEELGVSRTQWNQMLNHAQPMRRVYSFAVIGYMVMAKANARKT